MNKAEAWEWAAVAYAADPDQILFVHKSPRTGAEHKYSGENFTFQGLCHCLSMMVTCELITLTVRLQCLEDIKKFAPGWSPGNYCWPRGQRPQRAQFCQDMVVRLKGGYWDANHEGEGPVHRLYEYPWVVQGYTTSPQRASESNWETIASFLTEDEAKAWLAQWEAEYRKGENGHTDFRIQNWNGPQAQ